MSRRTATSATRDHSPLPQVTHTGGVFTSEADDRRARWAPSLNNDTCEENWCCISCDTMYSFDETQRTCRLCLPRCSAHGERLLFIDMSACDERGQAFYVCAQPMPHDMEYPLLSCLRTIACHVDRDISGARISQQLAEVCMQRWTNDEYEPVLQQMGSLVGAKRRIKRGRPKDWNSTKLGWQEFLDNKERGAGLQHNITKPGPWGGCAQKKKDLLEVAQTLKRVEVTR